MNIHTISKANIVNRFGHFYAALVVATFSGSGCATREPLLAGGLDPASPFIAVEPSDGAVADLDLATVSYQDPTPAQADPDLANMTLKSCLVRAVDNNRLLHRRTYAAQRAGLEQPIARRELFDPFLDTGYSFKEGEDSGLGRISVTGRALGFEVEPFVRFEYDEENAFSLRDDEFASSYGVAVARNVFRIRYEHMRQHLPLTRANSDFHIAINDRLLELRQLHLRVVELFYDIQRLRKRISVRENRVQDAREFLADVGAKVEAGFSAQVEETNARISLNQAESDLVREQTTLGNTVDRLLDLMGEDLAASATFVEDNLGDIPPAKIELEAEIELTRKYHETVRNQLLTMEVQRQAFWVSSEEVRPDLDAVFTAAEGLDSEGAGDETRVDLLLRLPLDNFSAERARRTQNRLRLKELAIELEGIRSDLERQLRQRYRTIHQLDTTVRLAETRVQEERRKLEAFTQIYEGVGGDVLEVTRAKQAVDQAEVDMLDAQISRIVEEARFQAIVPPAPEASVRSEVPDHP
jgi:outer membrane protein TolC